MRNSCKYVLIITIAALLAFAGGGSSQAAVTYPTSASGICASGNAVPPFLSGGVDPNLLLIIDNSGSMLDLAYVVEGSNCYDDTYDGAETYAGYFDPAPLYIYNVTTKQFELWSGQSYWYDAPGTIYYTTNVVYVKMGAVPNITGFIARGNFLNWAAASKIDIQKKILTGGKYDAAHNRMIMESRGCGNKRFIKKVPVISNADGSGAYVTLAVRQPRGPSLSWRSGTTYQVNDVVKYFGEYWRATAVTGASSGTTGPTGDGGATWTDVTSTYLWTAGAAYAAGAIVSDPNKANTLDEGQLYLAVSGGTAGAGGVDADNAGDATHPKWEPYNVTQIDIFEVTATGFDDSKCAEAASLLNTTDAGALGTIKADIDICMNATGGLSNPLADSNAAFNVAIYNCWYKSKQDIWPPGAGPETSQKLACERVYDYNSITGAFDGAAPWAIVPDDQAYSCYGINDWDSAAAGLQPLGYVGRCWEPGTPPTCTSWFTRGPNKDKCRTWSGGSGGTWYAGPRKDGTLTSSVAECIQTAMQDYCNAVQIPEVVDPSDQVPGTTQDTEGTFWNIPAVLVDSGVVAQLNQPLYTMQGFIQKSAAPSGLIQEFSTDLRIGAMVFNQKGTTYECTQPDPNRLFDCTFISNKDGGAVISAIDKAATHTTQLVNAVNGIKATSWTPIAEALYNALGYYGQNSALRLDTTDFKIAGVDTGGVDPVTNYCQNNNILVITEGASTADIKDSVTNFVATSGQNDADSGDVANCGSLKGSTLLDDLTYFAKHSLGCYASPTKTDAEGNAQDKQTISTHIVVAGTLRDTGAADECNPKVLLEAAAANGGTALYQANKPTELEDKIREAFAAIRAGAAAGSAASVISASRSGEGAAYQAIFWPRVDLTSGDQVEWIGEVHSLLVDSYGYLYEDNNGDHALDSGDQRIVFFFDQSVNQTKACVGELDAAGACTGVVVRLEDVHYNWSAAQWLSDILPKAAVNTVSGTEDILQNRTLVGSTSGYISSTKKRFIFTWDDLNNNGIVNSGEIFDFTPATDWAGQSVDSATRGPMTLDFGVRTNPEVDRIIRWMRGMDYSAEHLRMRQIPYDFNHDGVQETVTWRLGDVIHSTPISVGAPSEGFHFLYGDNSYAQFIAAYKMRRHMIYFGGNDGMMHAVNGGFYNEVAKKFCRTSDCSASSNVPDLGAEMWAYVPYNLLPHLKCMADPNYQHKYYVDQRPRIFDVRLWSPTDPTHVGGWGTILVGAMRFGGARVRPGLLDLDGSGAADYGADTREFISSYFIMDITNPEEPPTLLAEMTRTTSGGAELGYSLAIPTLVVMKDGSSYKWYLIMGSGPTDVNGTSNQSARLAVIPLDSLASGSQAFRVPAALPAAGSETGRFVLNYTSNAFVSDPVTVDYELQQDYKSDVVYFGTVAGLAAPYSGGMQRLVTRKINSSTGEQEDTLPHEWSTLLSGSSLSNPLPLINTNQPVTASASVGTDGKNYWVYFGTGRFLSPDDKADASQQTYYGIKEPLSYSGSAADCSSSFTWQTVEKQDVDDAHHNSTPGDQRLLNVSDMRVHQATTADTAVLSCSGGGSACLEISPVTLTTFDSLVDYIAGTGTGCNSATDSKGTDGWYKNFTLSKERNVGQATLLGGLVTYTSYQPYEDECLPEGLGYLYGVYFQTGTPFYIPIFVSNHDSGVDSGENVIEKVALGRGLATTPNLHVGKQEGAKAFVQTSTGTIVEIPQPNLPLQNAKTGKSSWGEVK